MPTGYNTTADCAQKIIKDYRNHRAVRDICKDYSVCWQTVFAVLKRHGIPPRRTRIRTISWQNQLEMVRLYKSGSNIPTLARQFSKTNFGIWAVLKRHDIICRPGAFTHTRTLDVSVFNELTEECAYWLGFLTADGGLRDDRIPQFELHLATKDEEHILSFRNFIKSDAGIQRKPLSTRISIRSRALADKLISYGIKFGGVREPVPELLSNRHFWRGVIDGDGTVGRYKQGRYINVPNIFLCGRFEVVNGFLDFAKRYIKTTVAPRRCERSTKPTYRLWLNSLNAQTVISILYSDCHVALPRKKAVADLVIQNPFRQRLHFPTPE